MAVMKSSELENLKRLNKKEQLEKDKMLDDTEDDEVTEDIIKEIENEIESEEEKNRVNI